WVVTLVYAPRLLVRSLPARTLLGLRDAEGSVRRAGGGAIERARGGRTVRPGARAGPGPQPACRVRASSADAGRLRCQARRADPGRTGGRGRSGDRAEGGRDRRATALARDLALAAYRARAPATHRPRATARVARVGRPAGGRTPRGAGARQARRDDEPRLGGDLRCREAARPGPGRVRVPPRAAPPGRRQLRGLGAAPAAAP